MKVVCIDNTEIIGGYEVYDLTIGKVYDVVVEELGNDIWYHLIDDMGREAPFSINNFTAL